MPSWPHFTHEFASPRPPDEVHRNVVTMLSPSLEEVGYRLQDHSDSGARFTRRYWPGWAIVGLLVGWALAAYAYSSVQDKIDNTPPPGMWIAAAIAVACIFIRRTEDLRLLFEPRVGGTVILVDGHARRDLQEMLRGLSDGSLDPAAMPKPGPAAQTPAPTAPPDAVEQIRRLAELRDSGALTDAEFEAKKKKLLDEV